MLTIESKINCGNHKTFSIPVLDIHTIESHTHIHIMIKHTGMFILTLFLVLKMLQYSKGYYMFVAESYTAAKKNWVVTLTKMDQCQK